MWAVLGAHARARCRVGQPETHPPILVVSTPYNSSNALLGPGTGPRGKDHHTVTKNRPYLGLHSLNRDSRGSLQPPTFGGFHPLEWLRHATRTPHRSALGGGGGGGLMARPLQPPTVQDPKNGQIWAQKWSKMLSKLSKPKIGPFLMVKGAKLGHSWAYGTPFGHSG